MKKNFNPIIYVDNDGLDTPDVGIWALEKYQLLGGYCNIFTKGMRSKWNNLVYIDLYASAGYSQIRETHQLVKSSALIALSIPTKFDKYIFCEENPVLFDVLSHRIQREKVNNATDLFLGDCNNKIQEIKNSIPRYSPSNTVLTFCFIDPFDLKIKFETVRYLASDLTDFLILQAFHMDANRNFRTYISRNNYKITNYLGRDDWRNIWETSGCLPKDFVKFLADQYDANMKELGYKTAIRHPIKLPIKNVPLYYLTFYSKHERGLDFFKKVDDYTTDQLNFGL